MNHLIKRALIIAALIALAGAAVFLWHADSTTETSPQLPVANQTPPPTTNVPANLAPLSQPAFGSTPTNLATPQTQRLGWGSGVGQLARLREQEANAEGPMSLAATADATLVLDQVNRRLVRTSRDGQHSEALPLNLHGAQELTVAANGNVLVMDRLSDKRVDVLSPSGQVVGSLPLDQAGIRETGAVTGLLAEGDKVYAEIEHGDWVTLGTTSGQAAASPEILPGKPTRDGYWLLTLGLAQATEGTATLSVLKRSNQAHEATHLIRFGYPLTRLVLLDSDARGTVYVGARLDGEPSQLKILCLNPANGAVLGTAQFPASTTADESFRSLSVSDDGLIAYLYQTEEWSEVQYQRCGATQ